MFPNRPNGSPSRSYVQCKTKSICSQPTGQRGIARIATAVTLRRDNARHCSGTGLPDWQPRLAAVPGQAREGGASYLGADREAWPCDRGIHNGGRPPCRHEARLCPRPVAQRAGPLKSKLAAERPPLEHSSKPRCSKDQATLQGTDFRNL